MNAANLAPEVSRLAAGVLLDASCCHIYKKRLCQDNAHFPFIVIKWEMYSMFVISS